MFLLHMTTNHHEPISILSLSTPPAELPHYRAGAPPVPVPVRVSPERGGLRAQAEVRPRQVRLPLRPGPQPGQVQLRPRPQVH